LVDIFPDSYHDGYHRVKTMATAQKARVFRNGRSQAVRIPAEYRFKTAEVYVERDAVTGALILSERPLDRPSLDAVFAALDAAGAADFQMHRDPAPPAEREWT
jgi:antitoxin VapB